MLTPSPPETFGDKGIINEYFPRLFRNAARSVAETAEPLGLLDAMY